MYLFVILVRPNLVVVEHCEGTPCCLHEGVCHAWVVHIVTGGRDDGCKQLKRRERVGQLGCIEHVVHAVNNISRVHVVVVWHVWEPSVLVFDARHKAAQRCLPRGV